MSEPIFGVVCINRVGHRTIVRVTAQGYTREELNRFAMKRDLLPGAAERGFHHQVVEVEKAAERVRDGACGEFIEKRTGAREGT